MLALYAAAAKRLTLFAMMPLLLRHDAAACAADYAMLIAAAADTPTLLLPRGAAAVDTLPLHIRRAAVFFIFFAMLRLLTQLFFAYALRCDRR